MADYKRFVSYMYEYENGSKKRNAGYARVEIRNGEYRFTIHLQLEGLLEGIFPTYLIHRPTGDMDLVYLGDCRANNQVIDSRLIAKEFNDKDSGYRISDMGGILLFLNSVVFYATEWDDKPVVLEEVLQALKPKSKPAPIKPDAKTPENKQPESIPILINKPAAPMPASFKKPTELNEDTAKRTKDTEANRPRYILPGGRRMDAREWYNYPKAPTNPWELVEKYKKQTEAEGKKLTKAEEEKTQEIESKRSSEVSDKDIVSKANNREKPVEKDIEDNSQRENPLAARIFSNYPRIYPFEDNEIRRCVKIEPKDIGALPSDTWILSNNSFLLHGYYCYHHLVFAEISDRYGCRYILGVPGIYHTRERFMARMFGFECFKSIRKRELKPGDFGYWYLEVKF